jgi:hypothetical protein
MIDERSPKDKMLEAMPYTGIRKPPAPRSDERTTQAERIMRDRTQPLTPVEEAFFGVPDHMAKPPSDGLRAALTDRSPINHHPAVKKRLNTVLNHDPRFRGIGYSEFITRALDALGAEG